MPNNTFCLGPAVLLIAATTAAAQDSMLDLIPPEAGAAVAVRNLNDLQTKADKFLREADINMPFRPSMLFAMAYQQLGIFGVVDGSKSGAIILIHPRTLGMQRGIGLKDLETLIVAAIPFKDRDKITARFGFAAGEAKPGMLIKTKRKNNDFGEFIYLRGKHLFLGNNEKAVRLAAAGKRLNKEFSAARRKQLADADILIHLGKELWHEGYQNFAKEIFSRFPEKDQNKELLRQLVEGVKSLQYMTGAVRINGGFGLSITANFDKKNVATKKLLAMLRYRNQTSGLNALPDGNIVVAQAAKGDGAATRLLAKALFDVLLRDLLQTGKIITAAERPLFVGVFSEVWQHLRGSRVAVYANEDEQKHGLFSFLAILDTQDTNKFFKEMKGLVTIADAGNLKLDSKGKKQLDTDVKKYVRDLAHPFFRVRERANLKLRLVGERALPQLRKAMKSPKDLEQLMRAQKLHDEIAALAAERRKALVAQNPFQQIRPTFALIPAAEKRAGHSINVMQIKLRKSDLPFRKPLKEFLGPQWQNIRMAIHGKQLVVLVGSDVGLLELALQNLDKQKKGIAGGKKLARFYGQSNDSRRFELHVSVARMLYLMEPEAARKIGNGKDPALSSLGLSIEEHQIQLDVWAPTSEVRLIAKKARW